MSSGAGLIQVMEGRHCFAHLTVEENLLTGAYTARDGRAAAPPISTVYGYFPRLKERRGSLAGYTSGGEQQMVAIGRALMAGQSWCCWTSRRWASRRSSSRRSSRSSPG